MTPEEIKKALQEIGVNAPDFIIKGWLALFDSIKSCLEANYDDDIARLIYGYLLQLYGLSYGGKYIRSLSSPSGASISFDTLAIGDIYRSIYGLLRMIDTAGCASGLIPPDPSRKAQAFLYVSKGGCH